jgi:hypothetical protein
VPASSIPPSRATPGSSPAPFCVKGLVYTGAQQFYEKRLQGGQAALGAELGDADVRMFWEQRFVPSTWYDVMPLMAINQAASRVAHENAFDLVRENARWVANRDIHGVYRFLLKLASPELVARKLPRASLQYLSFGVAEGEEVARRHFRLFHRGIPRPLVSWFTACVEGFAPMALEIAGASKTELSSRVIGGDGEVSGVPLVQIVHDLTWE